MTAVKDRSLHRRFSVCAHAQQATTAYGQEPGRYIELFKTPSAGIPSRLLSRWALNPCGVCCACGTAGSAGMNCRSSLICLVWAPFSYWFGPGGAEASSLLLHICDRWTVHAFPAVPGWPPPCLLRRWRRC